MFVLRERLRPLQWAAVGIGRLASVWLAVAGGVVPWIPLALAFSFGLYGLVKKKVGASLEAMHSLAAETTVLAPVAVVVLFVLAARDEITFAGHGGWHTTLLVLSGVVTAVPLLLFAAAARRIPLVTVGLIQFITPGPPARRRRDAARRARVGPAVDRVRHRLGGARAALVRLAHRARTSRRRAAAAALSLAGVPEPTV